MPFLSKSCLKFSKRNDIGFLTTSTWPGRLISATWLDKGQVETELSAVNKKLLTKILVFLSCWVIKGRFGGSRKFSEGDKASGRGNINGRS